MMMPTPLPAYRILRSPFAVDVRPGLVLAPMSGVTDSPFRRLVRHCSGDAVGLFVSEFINVDMLTRGQLRTVIRMPFHASERPIAIQLYGADPERIAEGARMVQDAGAEAVDINCGCPEPKICRRGGGAGLLRDLPRLAAILDGVTAAVQIPVTIKIRPGWDAGSVNYLETLKVAENHGASALAVHGRTRMQLYSGEADWGVVRALKARARIPILGSGDIVTPADALTRLAASGADGALIGRGAILNPWIFRQIADVAAGRPMFAPTWRDTIAALRHYLALLDAQYPPKVGPGRMRMMLARFLKGFGADPGLRVRCLKLATPEAMLAHLEVSVAGLGMLEHAWHAAPGRDVGGDVGGDAVDKESAAA